MRYILAALTPRIVVMDSARALDGSDLDGQSLHQYLQDKTFVEYFNSFLLLPVFSSKVYYNGDTGYFEQVFTGGIPGSERLGRGGGGGKGGSGFVTPSASSTSMSTLYLTDDCMGSPLDSQQCWQWVLEHRLPLFLKSDLFSEYKLCKRLTTNHLDPLHGLSMLTGQANNKGQPSFRKPISLTNSPSPRPQDDTKLRKSQRMVETQANDFPSAIESSVLRVSSSTSMLLPSLSQSSETQLEKKGSKTVQNKRSENALVELSSTKVGVSAKGSKSNTEIGSRGKTIKQVPSSSSQPNISTCSSDGNEEESSRGAHGSGDTPHGTAARETAVRTRSDGMSFSLAVDVCNDSPSPRSLRAVLSTKRGMFALWRFLQDTAGERSWLFWLDAERLNYCSSHEEQQMLLRELHERYLSAGGDLELSTDTKFRMGVGGASLGAGGVASVQSLQDLLVDRFRNYWCHRFLLHQQHKKQKSHTRPHTSLGIYIQHGKHACSTINYPRVETPLIPTKTPTFHRVSERTGISTRRSSPPRSRMATAPAMSSSRQLELGEQTLPKSGKREKIWERGSSRGTSSPVEVESRRESSKKKNGADVVGEERAAQRLRNKPIFDRENPKNPPARVDAVDRFKSSVVDGLKKLGGGSGAYVGSPRLPQSLRQSFASSPVAAWSKDVNTRVGLGTDTSLNAAGTSEDAVRRSPASYPSRSEDYRKLTMYTPRHLPDPRTHYTPSMEDTLASSHETAATTSCHILSISGTPVLPPSPPPKSPFSHMLHCLATEHRKAGGYFKDHLQSLANRVPLNCLLFWREVQNYKAMFLGPSFSPAAVQLKAKALYSQYIADSGPKSLSLPPSLPARLSSLLHPPYDDLFDAVEEHVLAVLVSHWEGLCRREEATFLKMDTVHLSRAGSARRPTPPSSYTALDDLTEEVDIDRFEMEDIHASPQETPQGTPHPSPNPQSSHFSSSQPSYHPSPRPESSQLSSSYHPSPLPQHRPESSQLSSSYHPSPLPQHSLTPHPLTPSQPPAPKHITLNDIVNNSKELEHFKVYLNENMAAQDLMCWMEIEAFRGIPLKNRSLRDMKARQLRERYFTRKYLLGPDSPAGKEAQRQIVAAGGGSGQYSSRLPARPKTPVFREAQKHVRAKLERKWLSLFLQSPEYIARNGVLLSEKESKTQSHTDSGRVTTLEQKFTHSREALLLRKILHTSSSRKLFLTFLAIRSTAHTCTIPDVEFWLEVQRFKGMCHAHSNQHNLEEKLKAIQDCYFNSSVPPTLHIDIPQQMADKVMMKNVGPYIFRESQATVFRHLYGYWQDYQAIASNLSPQEITAELDKMKRRMKERRKAAEKRDAQMKLEMEQRHIAVPRFETTKEQEERLKRERERQQFGDISVNFTLTKPHPEYEYYTELPSVDSESVESVQSDDVVRNSDNRNCVHSKSRNDVIDNGGGVDAQSTAGRCSSREETAQSTGGRLSSMKEVNQHTLGSAKRVNLKNHTQQNHQDHSSGVQRVNQTVQKAPENGPISRLDKRDHDQDRPQSVKNRNRRHSQQGSRGHGKAGSVAGSTVTVQLSSCQGQQYVTDVH